MSWIWTEISTNKSDRINRLERLRARLRRLDEERDVITSEIDALDRSLCKVYTGKEAP